MSCCAWGGGRALIPDFRSWGIFHRPSTPRPFQFRGSYSASCLGGAHLSTLATCVYSTSPDFPYFWEMLTQQLAPANTDPGHWAGTPQAGGHGGSPEAAGGQYRPAVGARRAPEFSLQARSRRTCLRHVRTSTALGSCTSDGPVGRPLLMTVH